MSNKGFVITTDAFISVILLSVLILASFFYMSQISLDSWDSVDLSNIAVDQLTVLEKSQIIENSIKQQSAELILSKINLTPTAYCVDVSIFKESDISTPFMYTIKSGCTKSFSELITVNRTIVVNNDSNVSFYIAKLGTWYK